LPTPLAFDAPVKRVPVRILPYRLVRKKARMVRLPDGEKIEDIFTRLERIYERDRHSDGRTDRHCITA